MATIYALPMSFAGWLWAKDIIPFFIDDLIATPLTIDYASIIFLSLLFSAYSFVFQGFYTGIEKTKIHMVVTIISNIINVYLNVGLIYGSDGVKTFFLEAVPQISFISQLWQWTDFPALGVKGAAIATLIASLWMSIHYGVYLFSKQIKIKFAVFSLSINRLMMHNQLRLAVPQGLQEMFIAVGWSMA